MSVDREKLIKVVEGKLLTALHLVGITKGVVPSLAYEIVDAVLGALPAGGSAMAPDPAVEAVMADGSWDASPLGACGVRRMVRGRVAEGLVRLVREADTAALAADRELEPVQITDEMVARARRELRRWTSPPAGPTAMRAALVAALSESPPEGESDG